MTPDQHEEVTVDGDHAELLRAVLRHLSAVEVLDPELAGRFLGLAFRGYGVREHFDAHHPEQIEVGERMAPAEAKDREAWLFGYRFVERRKETQQ